MEQKERAFIGLDLGGTFLKYALGTEDGTIRAKGKLPSNAQESKEAVFAVMFTAVEELLEVATKQGLEIAGIGVGSPGAIDYNTGRVLGNTPNLPKWPNADIRGNLQGRFGIPVWADNDANVAILAEARYGAAKEYINVIGLTLGTGIGGGIVIDDQLFRGARFSGAELGHMSINFEGPLCGCGNPGCLEVYASAPAMVRNYAGKLKSRNLPVPEGLSTEVIFANAKTGEEAANETIDETCFYLGCGIGNIVNIFNPDVVVIGGGVADAGDEFIARIWKSVQGHALAASLEGVRLVRAQMGNDAGVVGALALAADAVKAARR
ncbi:MAG TPA: ROK family protein [bacterium]|nr:ROK family protein [bacterium]HQG44408.1 ROK family protein [bacterium]HQI48213.1 ROK family protein [bacterium]HQJ64785.1 ROK family protein [bacterium]